VVSCVTNPHLSSCIKAAVTVALVVATAGEGEVEVAAMNAAEEGGADIAEQVGAKAAESCGLSFTPGTKVLLANGKAVPISSLKPGEKVVSTSTKTGKTQAGTIAAVQVHHDTNRYDLTVRARGRTAVIHTTSNHPFWDATTHRWVKAGALRYGTHLRTAAGGTATVLGGHAPRHRSGWMWDLTIPGNHDFYVIAADTDVLVHNCGEELTSDELRAQARDKWEAVTGHPAIWDRMVIHHEVPLEWRHVYSGDINGLDNLRGMLAEDHYGITEAWRVWKVGLQGRTPSEAELLQQRNSLRNIYGPLMVSP
jgi:hypothetical protein